MIDGTGAPARRADVLINGGRISALGTSGADAARVLDVRGLVVTPGFIDIHAHSDEAMFVNSALESALHMGVTTVVNGNCGGSAAPIAGEAAADAIDRDLERSGLTRDWSSFAEYARAVERNGIAVNVCSYVGHGTLRASVIGNVAREPDADELAAMRSLLAASLDEGAIGLASGLIYPPSAFGTTAELAALALEVAERGGIYASHIRNESGGLLEAVEENLEVGRRSGVRVQLSHHKAAGRENWGKVRQSTALIERAQAEGLDVAADQYPYSASATGLSVTIPNWVHEGGAGELCRRLAEPAVRERIHVERVETGRAWDRIVIARACFRPEWAGRTVADLAREVGMDPLDWTCDALIAHEGAIDIIHHSMDETDVRHVMAKPWVCIGSDSRANAPYGPLSSGKPHPRAYGTFPRVLGRYARDLGLFSFAEAVRKMTGLTASRLRLRDRGVLREGAAADLVVLDPASVLDLATFEDPHRYPRGIEHVVVNGVLALEHGETTVARPGRFLRLGVDLG